MGSTFTPESADALADHLARYGLRDLRPLEEGLIFQVYRAVLDHRGQVIVRVPKHRWHPLGRDGKIDTRNFLRHEVVMTKHARRFGIPSPEIYLDHSDDELLAFTVAAYVENDGSPIPRQELGALVARIHTMPIPTVRSGDQDCRLADEVVIRRIQDQAKSIEDLAGVAIPIDEGALQLCLTDWVSARAVLHMDVRDVNLLTLEGKLVALIDWGNMLIGDPALEWARLEEFGIVDRDFEEGYAMIGAPPRAPAAVNYLYRLDTAMMLAAVHCQFELDPGDARRYLERAQILAEGLAEHGG